MTYINRYRKQKKHAERRGIDFKLSYQEWLDWWGDDLDKRGRGMGKLQMCRLQDKGCYELGNIFKSTHEQNMKDKIVNGTHRSRPRVADQLCIDFVNSCLQQGLSTRRIAKEAGISQRTVIRIKLKEDTYG